MISYKLVSHCKPLGPIISELKALLSLAILVWPWRRGSRSNLTTPKDSQPMISYRSVYHPKPLGPIIREIKAIFMTDQKTTRGSNLVFQNEAKNISSQDFVMWNIFCEFEISTYNTLCSSGPTKVLALSWINIPGGYLVFQKEAKNIPRQDFMVMNIACKFKKVSYNIFFFC